MLSALLLLSSLATVALGTNVTPTGPAPGDHFQVGGTCTISWTPGTSSEWQSMDVWLQTGPNSPMVQLLKVLDGVDGTASPGSYSYTCPDVTPNSEIYFYQFNPSSGSTSANTFWTGRFWIAAEDGSTTPPTNESGGVSWGTGVLVGSGGSSSGNSTSGSSSSSGGATGLDSTTSSAASSSSSSTAGPYTSTMTVTTGGAEPTADSGSGNGASSLRVASGAAAGVLAAGLWLF